MLPDWTKLQGSGAARLGVTRALSPYTPTHLSRAAHCLGVPSVTSTDSYCALCLPGLTLPTYKGIKEGPLHFRAQLASETPWQAALTHPTIPG